MFDTEIFISAVEKYPCIFDSKQKEYSDRDAKQKAWNVVVDVVVEDWATKTSTQKNAEVKELQKKWKSIRDCFKRELRLQKAPKSGDAARKRKKYAYFDNLLFLIPTLEERPSASNLDAAVSSDEDQPEGTGTGDLNVDLETTRQQFKEFDKTDAKKSKRGKTSMSDFECEVLKFISSGNAPSPQQVDDDDKLFLLSLLPALKKVPPADKMMTRMRLMEVVNAAQFPNQRPSVHYPQSRWGSASQPPFQQVVVTTNYTPSSVMYSSESNTFEQNYNFEQSANNACTADMISAGMSAYQRL